jgi:putative membrane protein
LQVQAQPSAPGAITTSDRAASRFIKEAARNNETQVSLAQVGAQKAQNTDLKSFCEKLERDHTKASKDLQALAQKYNVNTEPSGSEQREVTKLEKDNAGVKFDQQLATELLKGHQRDITKFEKASTQIQEADVKEYIDTMLPKLKDHFQQAQTVARSVGVDESTITSSAKKVTSAAVGGTAE